MAAVSFATVAASIFGPVVSAQASGMPGDPTIPPPDGQCAGVPGACNDGDPAMDVRDPNGNLVTVANPVYTMHSIVSDSSGLNQPWVLTADITQPVTQGTAPPAVVVPRATGGGLAPATFVNTTWVGCRSVESIFDASFTYGFGWTYTFYQYHVHLDWCGDGHGNVTKPNHYDYVTNTDVSTNVGSLITDDPYYYDAWGALPGGPWPKSGYSVFMQRHMESGFGSISRGTNPWGQAIGFGDGVAYIRAGVG